MEERPVQTNPSNSKVTPTRSASNAVAADEQAPNCQQSTIHMTRQQTTHHERQSDSNTEPKLASHASDRKVTGLARHSEKAGNAIAPYTARPRGRIDAATTVSERNVQ